MRKYILTFIAAISVVGLLQLVTPNVNAQFEASKNQACEGLEVDSTEFIDCESNDGGDTLKSILATTLNILSFIAGVIAVIMVIIGGIRFITSSGDPSSASAARQTIIYAIVGIVIVAVSQLIVQFVLETAEQDPTPPVPVENTEFNPPGPGNTVQ